ncbi:MAG: hypothetical protein V1861_00930 [Candidatus Micrarchaeota archaeon]
MNLRNDTEPGYPGRGEKLADIHRHPRSIFLKEGISRQDVKNKGLFAVYALALMKPEMGL